jgi:hypothetical protein
MNCRTFRRNLKDWMMREWDQETLGRGPESELSDELRDHAEKCEDCRGRLDAALVLLAPGGLSAEPPRNLTSRVMAKIRHESDHRVERSATSPAARARRRWVSVAAAAVLLVAGSVSLTLGFVDRGASAVVVQLTFEAPRANAVSVVGDWNGWDPTAHSLSDPDADGTWSIELRVEAGKEYQYQFIVDGEKWVPDPNAAIHVSDGFGGTNSILNI